MRNAPFCCLLPQLCRQRVGHPVEDVVDEYSSGVQAHAGPDIAESKSPLNQLGSIARGRLLPQRGRSRWNYINFVGYVGRVVVAPRNVTNVFLSMTKNTRPQVPYGHVSGSCLLLAYTRKRAGARKLCPTSVDTLFARFARKLHLH